jgi:CHASE2 domain-containing sensor protein
MGLELVFVGRHTGVADSQFLRLGLAGGAALGILYGLSFGLICQGGWVPLVPSGLALVITGGTVVIHNSRIQKVKPNVSYD